MCFVSYKKIKIKVVMIASHSLSDRCIKSETVCLSILPCFSFSDPFSLITAVMPKKRVQRNLENANVHFISVDEDDEEDDDEDEVSDNEWDA
jgi:hypothetical protein